MNPADQKFEDRLYKRLANVEKQLQDIKTAQRMGADNFQYDLGASDVPVSIYLNTGEEHTYTINFNSDHPKYYVGEIGFSFFFNNDLDLAYHYPDGAVVMEPTNNLLGFDFFCWYDWYMSDETGIGQKRFYLRIINYGALAKTVHTHIGMVYPLGGIN